jgi:hypothetical protein
MKKSSDTIGNRPRDLPACSTVPQPTALSRAPNRGIDLLFVTLALEGCVWSALRPGRFKPGKDSAPIVQEAGWAPGPVWTCAKNLALTGIRSPDRPARSQSLYRLSYPGSNIKFTSQNL